MRGQEIFKMPLRIDVEIDIEKNRDRGGLGQTDTRWSIAKDGVKGGGKVWKNLEIWNGGTEERSTCSTRRVGGLLKMET